MIKGFKELEFFTKVGLLIKNNKPRLLSEFERDCDKSKANRDTRNILKMLIERSALVEKDRIFSYKRYIINKKEMKKVVWEQEIIRLIQELLDLYGLALG